MNKTEIYKGLERPAPASTKPASTASIVIDTAEVVEALCRANINTAEDLAKHLKPVGTSMSVLAGAANRATADFMEAMRNTREELARVKASADEVTRQAEARIESATAKHDAVLAKLTKRQMVLMALVAALAGPLSASICYVLQKRYSGQAESATNWDTFEKVVMPQMGQRCRTELHQILKSSSAH